MTIRPIYLLAVLLIGITSCSPTNSEDHQAAENTAALPPPALDTVTESRHAYVTEYAQIQGDYYLKVDYVEYYTDDAATVAEWEDEAYFAEDGETISTITDGYYIRNNNPRLRTFKVDKAAKVDRVLDGNGPHPLNNPLNETYFKDVVKWQKLLVLKVEDGVVIGIDEVFLP